MESGRVGEWGEWESRRVGKVSEWGKLESGGITISSYAIVYDISHRLALFFQNLLGRALRLR